MASKTASLAVVLLAISNLCIINATPILDLYPRGRGGSRPNRIGDGDSSSDTSDGSSTGSDSNSGPGSNAPTGEEDQGTFDYTTHTYSFSIVQSTLDGDGISLSQGYAYPSAEGGSDPRVITGSIYRFEGRSSGGAKRAEIYGNHFYGSGYTTAWSTGVEDVAGKHFPFGFWPIYWDDGFGGSQEYGPANSKSREGGPLVYYPFSLSSSGGSGEGSFAAVGDEDSMALLIRTLRKSKQDKDDPGCEIDTGYPLPFNSTVFNQKEVVQYYRASSFALVQKGFDNTITPFTLPTMDDQINCVNATIGSVLAIMDDSPPLPPSLRNRRSGFDFAKLGIIIGGTVAGLSVCLVCCCFCLKRRREKKARKEMQETAAKYASVPQKEEGGSWFFAIATVTTVQPRNDPSPPARDGANTPASTVVGHPNDSTSSLGPKAYNPTAYSPPIYPAPASSPPEPTSTIQPIPPPPPPGQRPPNPNSPWKPPHPYAGLMPNEITC